MISLAALSFAFALARASPELPALERSGEPRTAVVVEDPEGVFEFREETFLTGFIIFDPVSVGLVHLSVFNDAEGLPRRLRPQVWVFQRTSWCAKELNECFTEVVVCVISDHDTSECEC